MSVNLRLFHIAATVAPLETRMAGAPAFAQGAALYEGSWAAEIDSLQRHNVPGRATIRDDGGTWTTVSGEWSNPRCGRAAPPPALNAPPSRA